MSKTTLGELQLAARAVGANAVLQDIRLLGSTVQGSAVMAAEEELFVVTNVTTMARQREDTVEVISEYKLRAHPWDPEQDDAGDPADEEDGDLQFDPATDEGEDVDEHDDEAIAWDIHAAFLASFLVRPGTEPFTDQQLEAFTYVTGAMAIHPFAREYVQTMTTRMGYPPFTMPFMRRPGDASEHSVTAPIDTERHGGIPTE